MEQPRRKNEDSIRSLIDMGTRGYFPLFRPEWIEEIFSESFASTNNSTPNKSKKNYNRLTGQEKEKAKSIIQRLAKHRSIERKQIVISAMDENERKLLVRAFMKMVEGKILDAKPGLH